MSFLYRLLILFIMVLLFSREGYPQELFLAIRQLNHMAFDDNNIYQTTRYVNSSKRCQCNTVPGDRSLLQYSERVDACMDDPFNVSALDVCSFLNFSGKFYHIEVQRASEASRATMNATMNATQLCNKIEGVREALARFEALLAQTIVCVYLNNCEDKNLCLQSYINWVCMTQLKVYRNSSMSSMSNHSADIIDGDDGLQYEHVKPCYGVCTQVLSHCPYYLPSSYQHDRDGETMEYVYGGYPAFACPGSDIENPSYIYDCSNNCCVEKNGAISRHMSILLLLVTSILLKFLT